MGSELLETRPEGREQPLSAGHGAAAVLGVLLGSHGGCGAGGSRSVPQAGGRRHRVGELREGSCPTAEALAEGGAQEGALRQGA